jgi:hypothetical protein
MVVSENKEVEFHSLPSKYALQRCITNIFQREIRIIQENFCFNWDFNTGIIGRVGPFDSVHG